MNYLAFASALERNPRLRITLLAGFFFFLLFARRSAQLLYPQIWDEDGLIISDIVQSGPLALMHPINGYFVLAPKIVMFVAMLFPLPAVALIGTILAWIFIVTVLIAIALSPTMLKGGTILALVALLVPSNAEVYGIPLYTLWWAPLLLVIATFWSPGAKGLGLRIAFGLIGGLSSPFVVIVAPLAIAIALYYRKRSEAIFALVCVFCAVVQILSLFPTMNGQGASTYAIVPAAFMALPKFIGMYVVGNIWVHAGPLRSIILIAFTVAPFILIALALWKGDARSRMAILCLTYLLLGSILLSCDRVNPAIFDPATAGPRYFFYPYVMLGWLLVQCGFSSVSVSFRRCAIALLILAAFNVLPVLNRTHDDLNWTDRVAQCEAAPRASPYVIPIQFAGTASVTWYLTLTGSECRRLSRFGLAGLAFRN